MDDVKLRVSTHRRNGSVDLEGSEDGSHDLSSGENHIIQSSSPISDDPKDFPVSADRPKIRQDASPRPIVNHDETLDHEHEYASHHGTAYVRPRVRIFREDRKSLDEIEFSGDELDSNASPTAVKVDKRVIDTSAPFESVRAAVSKFGAVSKIVGGVADWKTNKSHSMERRKSMDQELEKVREEIPVIKQQTEVEEEAKTQALKDLEATNRLIQELKVNLEKAQVEEQQAKQDSEVAKMRVKEMEKELFDGLSAESKKELKAAQAKHGATVSELKCIKGELESLEKEYSDLASEKEVTLKRAELALSESKEVEKSVEDMNREFASTKESLESARAVHHKAQEQRNGAVMTSEQDALTWDKELKQAEEDMEKLNQQIQEHKVLKTKLSSASSLLANLKSELAAYKEPKSQSVANSEQGIEENELEELKSKTKKATDEVNCLKASAESLKTEIERERLELASLRQREGMASVAVASLEAELERIKTEISELQTREKETKDKMAELTAKLQVAAQEADEARSAADSAREALRKVKEEAELAKAGAQTVERRLVAAQKEIEAARASEKHAIDAIKALKESNCKDRPNRLTIPLEEYNELSKRAHEAEQQAKAKVAAAMAQIEEARNSEAQTLSKLAVANEELLTRKEVYTAACNKVERANEAKLKVEQELRTWRAENEQRRKVGDGLASSPSKSIEEVGSTSHEQGQEPKSSEQSGQTGLPRIATKESEKSDSGGDGLDSPTSDTSPDVKGGKKKKKPFFPRFFMFFNKKKLLSRT